MTITKKQIGERIREVRDRLGMTQSQLAEATGFGHKSISGYELGNSDTSPVFLAKIAQLGETTTDWLITGQPEVKIAERPQECSNVTTIPVHAVAGAGHPCCIDQLEPIGHITIDKSYNGPNIQVIKVRGSSMEPTIMDGGYVGVDMNSKEIVSGQMYAVYIPHEGIVVKRIWIGPEKVKIVSDNPTAPDHEIMTDRVNWDSFVQGRVKWVLQEYYGE